MSSTKTADPERGIWVARKLRRLVPAQLEAVLYRAALFEHSRPGAEVTWADRAREGVFFDLSAVEWIEVGALAQVVLLVEKAIRDGLPVAVAVPFRSARKDEQAWIAESSPADTVDRERSIQEKVAARRRANGFLDYLRFVPAIRATHLENTGLGVGLLEEFDASAFAGEESLFDVEAGPPPPISPRTRDTQANDSEETYQYDTPLTWLSPNDSERNQQLGAFLAGVLGERHRGLQEQLAKTIANVILYELADNVGTHARGPGWALLAASARSEHFFASRVPQSYRKDFLAYEGDYLDWMVGDPKPLVEIVVGDSGCGIPSGLGQSYRDNGAPAPFPRRETANVLAWAFDRWSSSKRVAFDRGTRGLYRVDRVVKRAQGLVTIRAGDEIVGWDHGGPNHDTLIRAHERLAPLPGTVVRIRLPAFQSPVFPRRIARGPEPPLAPEATCASPTIVRLGPVIQGGPSARDEERLAHALKVSGQSEQPCPVVAVVEGGSDEKEAVEAFLRKVVELRHPASLVVVGLPGAWSQIEAAIDSVNQMLWHSRLHDEALQESQHEIWDPVIVLGNDGSVGYAGTEPAVDSLLEALRSSGGRLGSTELKRHIPNPTSRLSLLQRVRVDTHLIRLDENNGVQLIPPFSLGFVADAFSHHIRERRDGVIAGPFVTPSLVVVNYWLHVPTLIEASIGQRFALLLLANAVRAASGLTLESATLVADSTTDPDLVDHLAENLGLETLVVPGDGGLPIPRLSSVFPPQAAVVVFCEVLESGNSVRRILAQARRDKAVPLAVACVIDSRQNPGKPIEVWDRKVPVVALANINLGSAVVPTEENVRYIAPVAREPEPPEAVFPSKPANEPRFPEQALFQLVETTGALHFGHIGELLGRHFTLYLDAGPLVENGGIIDSFEREIRGWLGDSPRALNQLELWYPSPEPKVAGLAQQIAEALCARLECREPRPMARRLSGSTWAFGPPPRLLRKPDVVVVDWGALSGASVAQLLHIAARSGARRILVCVFLSQLPRQDEAFLQSLRVIAVPREAEEQVSLDFSPAPERPASQVEAVVSEISVPCSVRFLGRFPITAYSSLDCPVCGLRDRLRDDIVPTPALQEFADWQQREWFRLTARGDIRAQPQGSTTMVRIRQALVEAQQSTRKRALVARQLVAWSNSLQVGAGEPSLEILELLRLLSVETQWLHNPPLNLQRERDHLVTIARTVALREDCDDIARMRATAVLRMASKFAFASALESLLRLHNASPRFLQQIAYYTLTCFHRPYPQSSRVAHRLKDALDNAVSYSTALGSGALWDLRSTISTLAVRAAVEVSNTAAAQLTPPEAWRRLRETLLADHEEHETGGHGLAMSIVLLKPFERTIDVALRAAQPGERGVVSETILESIRAASGAWQLCRQWLDTSVLPLLRALRGVVEGRAFLETVGAAPAARLLQLCDSATVAETDFSRLVSACADEPSRLVEPLAWSTFRSEARWYYDNVFMDNKDGLAPLRDFVGLEPTSLERAFRTAISSIANAGATFVFPDPWEEVFRTFNPPIFLPLPLATRAIYEILTNVERYSLPQQSPEIRLDFSATSDPAVVALMIKNNGTKPDRLGRGVGMIDMAERLDPFGGSLRGNTRPDDGWSTYIATLTVLTEAT